MRKLELEKFRTRYHDNVREDVIDSVPQTSGTLVDFGGGVGATAAHLKRAGRAVRVGVVDMMPMEDRAPLIDFAYCGDLEDPDFVSRVIDEEGPFEVVLCLDILEHLADPWRLVEQLHKSLTSGGVIVASIPNVRYFQVSFALFFRNRWTLRDSGVLDRTHLRFFVRETAIELMTRSGLVLEQVVPSPDMRSAITLFRRITFGLLNSFTDRQYIIRVRECG